MVSWHPVYDRQNSRYTLLLSQLTTLIQNSRNKLHLDRLERVRIWDDNVHLVVSAFIGGFGLASELGSMNRQAHWSGERADEVEGAVINNWW